jgi:hypothetical protein
MRRRKFIKLGQFREQVAGERHSRGADLSLGIDDGEHRL